MRMLGRVDSRDAAEPQGGMETRIRVKQSASRISPRLPRGALHDDTKLLRLKAAARDRICFQGSAGRPRLAGVLEGAEMRAANVHTDNLGIIAGSLSLPLELAKLARKAGVSRLVAVAFEGETDPALAALVDDLVWVRVGQLGRMIDVFRKRGVSQCAMAGQVHPKNLFEVRPDLRGISVLWKLKERNARTIFSAVADELAKDGIELVDARGWLQPLMPGAGWIAGPTPSPELREDLEYGYRIAKEVSRLDIGQTVVVKNGTVLAVEGFEGTDECLRRGGGLAGKSGGATAVKVASERHDFRFDIPCLGPGTLTACAGVKIVALGFEAGKTLLLERSEVEAFAIRQRITLLALG